MDDGEIFGLVFLVISLKGWICGIYFCKFEREGNWLNWFNI